MAEDLHYLILATDLHWGANQRWLQDYSDSVDMHCSYFDYYSSATAITLWVDESGYRK